MTKKTLTKTIKKRSPRKPRALVIAPKNVQLNAGQKLEITKNTPARFIKRRPGKGGGQFDYVEIGYVIDQLNKIFGELGWDRKADIVPKLTTEDYITVKVKLIVKDHKGHSVVKTAFGGSDRKRFSDKHKLAGKYMDIANDAKAAEADGLKKAASHFGIAFDVYYPDVLATKKFIEAEFEEVNKKPSKSKTYYCDRCIRDKKKTKISKEQADYTFDFYGYTLCPKCQKAAEQYSKNQAQDKGLYAKTLKTIRTTKDKKGLTALIKKVAKMDFTDQQRGFVKSQIDERIKEL